MTPDELSHLIYQEDDDAARVNIEAVRWPNGPVFSNCWVVNEGICPLAISRCGQDGIITSPATINSKPEWELFISGRICLCINGFWPPCRCLPRSFSSHQLSRTLNVTYNVFVAHRIREADHDTEPFGGRTRLSRWIDIYWTRELCGRQWQRLATEAGNRSKWKVISAVERGLRNNKWFSVPTGCSASEGFCCTSQGPYASGLIT